MIDSFFYGSCRADYNMCKLGKVESGHGDGVVRQLSVDLKERYPKMGLSPRNLWYMKRFYLRYCGSDVKVQRSVALLPWSHNVYLLGKNLNDSATLYYAQETIEKGWNRDLLLNAIKLNMYESQLATKVDNNFSRTLPMEQAKYANFFAFRGADGHRGRTLQST